MNSVDTGTIAQDKSLVESKMLAKLGFDICLSNVRMLASDNSCKCLKLTEILGQKA